MVGILIASHGTFARGIYESGNMIFGQQDKVRYVYMLPEEGPEDIREKMKKAIDKLDCQEVLILVDIWGGTPFNQASLLLEQHPNWQMITGMNLPMLLEAYSARMNVETAKEVALQIYENHGIQSKPKLKVKHEELKEEKKEVADSGQMEYVLCRIDSRLLHGQVATTWVKILKPDRIIVVSDSVCQDELRKNLIIQACPSGSKAHVVPIRKLIEVDSDPRFGKTKALLLFENPEDVLKAVEGGVRIESVNLGTMAHQDGKIAVNGVLSFGPKDVESIEALMDKGVEFDIRKVPNDNPEQIEDLLKKAKEKGM